MTYLQAAMDIIEMYNNYAGMMFANGESCGNHSKAVALAVEALSIVAGMESPVAVETAGGSTLNLEVYNES